MILDATIELQQPCVPMPRAFVMDGTSKDSEMEHDLASNIEDISDEKGVITLPLTWSISQAPVKLGIEIILCQIKTLMENDKKNLAVKKYIVIADWSENDFKHLQNNYTDPRLSQVHLEMLYD
ncbi:hypothetical protein DBV15_11937 [Temnothorax longispinosus]|uniref:Uncharacterized protein n=1 Tax=Temnothorax longispinosus TaxID=300112 RepID=A0A4S2K8S9_9HYME|nr:hypothetical protein DBV15_11937 [Temnothorax longispinosus]